MLEGLMQHDYPLTLQLLLDRMRRLYANDGTVVSVRGEDKTSMGYGEIVERVEKLAQGARRAGRPARRPRRHLRLEHPRAPRDLHGRALHGRRPPHPQRAPLRRAAHLHRQPRRGQGDLGRGLARPRPRGARPHLRDRRALHRHRRWRHRQPPQRAPLRGAARATRPRLRLPGTRRPPGRRPLLHERHHRQPQGRPLLAPLQRPARPRADHGRLDRRPLRRPRHAGGPHVPRQRLGHPLRIGLHRRRPRPARRQPQARRARHPDQGRTGDPERRRPHHLDGPAPLRGRKRGDRPLQPPPGDLRRLRGAAHAHAGARRTATTSRSSRPGA